MVAERSFAGRRYAVRLYSTPTRANADDNIPLPSKTRLAGRRAWRIGFFRSRPPRGRIERMGSRDSSKAHELRKRLAGTAWVAQEHELWFGRNSFLFRENGDLIATSVTAGGTCVRCPVTRSCSSSLATKTIIVRTQYSCTTTAMTIIHDLASKTYESIHPSDFKNAEVDSNCPTELKANLLWVLSLAAPERTASALAAFGTPGAESCGGMRK